MESKKTVDVIIPCYHPGKKFDELLRRLSEQDYPPHRIILINTEEAGLDNSRVEPYDNVEVHHIRKEDFDHGRSRNLGVSYSHSDYFLCMTDDAVPANAGLIAKLVEGMERDSRIAAVFGRQLATEESSFEERFSRSFNYPLESYEKGIADLEKMGIKTYFQSNVCCLYRRDIFDKLGGFTEPCIFNEDMIYCAAMLKAGYLSRYEAEAEVYHAHHYSGGQQLHRNFDLGVSQALHPEVFSGVKSEGEGIRMVRRNAVALIRQGKPYLLPLLIYRSACKFLGYRLGKAYARLPKRLVLRLSMNKMYWKEAL